MLYHCSIHCCLWVRRELRSDHSCLPWICWAAGAPSDPGELVQSGGWCLYTQQRLTRGSRKTLKQGQKDTLYWITKLHTDSVGTYLTGHTDQCSYHNIQRSILCKRQGRTNFDISIFIFSLFNKYNFTYLLVTTHVWRISIQQHQTLPVPPQSSFSYSITVVVL